MKDQIFTVAEAKTMLVTEAYAHLKSGTKKKVTSEDVRTFLITNQSDFYWTKDVVKSLMPVEKAERKAKTVTTALGAGNKSQRIGKKKALDLMKGNKGHFFTAEFVTKEGSRRTINCQYLKDQSQSELGYVKVQEAIKRKMDPEGNAIRQINMQTLKSLKIAGQTYKVN